MLKNIEIGQQGLVMSELVSDMLPWYFYVHTNAVLVINVNVPNVNITTIEISKDLSVCRLLPCLWITRIC